MMRILLQFLLILFSLSTWSAHATTRSLTTYEIYSKSYTNEGRETDTCQTKLVTNPEEKNEAIIEAILFLSYDHPLVHHIVKRAKSTYDIELFLNMLWGFQYPMYVEPGTELQYDPDDNISLAKTGKIVFPLLTVKKYFNDDKLGFNKSAYKEDMSTILRARLDNYLAAASWEKWKTLSYDHRKKIAEHLLKNIYYMFRKISEGKQEHPELDPRINHQHVTYQIKPASSIGNRHPGDPDLQLPTGYDLFLPTELDKFLNIFGRIHIHNALLNPLVAYLTEHLPLLIERRIEVLNLRKKLDADYKPNFLTIVPERKFIKLGKRIWHSIAKPQVDTEYLLEPVIDGRSFISRHYSLDELKAAITESTGPTKFRIHQDVTLLRTQDNPLPQPEEMKLDAPTETPFTYDLQQFTSSPHITTELPAGKIHNRILTVPEPSTENLKTPAQVRNYGTEVFFYLNLLSQNLGALKGGNQQVLAKYLTTFLQDLEQQGIKMDSKKFHELRLHLTAFETNENSIHLHTEQIETEVDAFITKVDQHLNVLRTFSESIQENDEFKLAVTRKIEELQTVLVLSKAQIQPALKLRKENQELTYNNIKNLQMQLMSLTAKSVLAPYTAEDMASLAEALARVQSALQLKEGGHQ